MSFAEKHLIQGETIQYQTKLHWIVMLGHAGLTDGFVASLNHALEHHGLVKIRFTDFKEEKKTLAPEIAERTQSELVTLVGNVAVFFRAKAAAAIE